MPVDPSLFSDNTVENLTSGTVLVAAFFVAWRARFSGSPSGQMTFANGNAALHSERYMWCSIFGAMRYLTLFPIERSLADTGGESEMGEKTARAPDDSL